MELIYLWIEKYRNIHKTGYSFSQNFSVNYVNNTQLNRLDITPSESTKSVFNNKMSNVTAIIGTNGSGKTNILDLLGLRREDRIKLGKSEYFIVYHLKNNEFAIEGSGIDLIKPMIKGLSEINIKRISYSIIIEEKNGCLGFKEFLQENEAYKSMSYMQYRSNYSSNTYRSIRSFSISSEKNIFLNRLNLNNKNIGNQAIYKMLIDLNNKKQINREGLIYNTSAYLRLSIKQDFNENKDHELPIKDLTEEMIILSALEGDLIDQNEKDLKFNYINMFKYKFSQSIASYIEGLDKGSNFLDKLSNYESELGTRNKERPATYYNEIIAFLFEEIKSRDKYINSELLIHIYKNFLNGLQSLNKIYFKEKMILVPLKHGYFDSKVFGLLGEIDEFNLLNDEEINLIANTFNVTYSPLSSGEHSLLLLFSAIHHGSTLKINRYKKRLIILLDEPEHSLHPEWSRFLIDYLDSFLNQIDDGFDSYQVIVTTHSPFIISDIPTENLIALRQDINGDSEIIRKELLGNTFASDIHTLLSNEFFMSSTMGMFSKRRINDLIDFLNNKSEEKYDKSYVDYLINIIGEPILKRKLEFMRDEKFPSNREKFEKIQKLKAELRELQNDTNIDF